MKIKISITDDKGDIYEGETDLKKVSASRRDGSRSAKINKNWYESGGTIDKLVKLIGEGFFDTNRSLSDIIKKFSSLDYSFKGPDLTLPLRKIVRHDLLRKTKDLPDGKKSKYWTWIKY